MTNTRLWRAARFTESWGRRGGTAAGPSNVNLPNALTVGRLLVVPFFALAVMADPIADQGAHGDGAAGPVADGLMMQ